MPLPPIDPGLASQATPEAIAGIPGALRRVEGLCQEWGLVLEAALPGANCALVYRGRDSDGRPIALKVPIEEEERSATPAMLAFSGFGGVDVLRTDAASGSVLMPLMMPGTSLASAYGLKLEGTRTIARLIRGLHQAPVVARNTVEDWMAGMERLQPCGSSLDESLADIKRVSTWLQGTTRDRVLLHGDLHHYNVLQNGDAWVVIDPKGILGDPAFEPAAALRNPFDLFGDADLSALQRDRVLTFAEDLSLPVERIWGWGVALNTLSALGWSSGGAIGRETLRAVEGLWFHRHEFWPL